MTAITKDQPLRPLGPEYTHKFVMDSSQAQAWYRGEALIIDQSADTVNVSPVHDITHPVVAATDVFMGIAMEGGSFAISTAETLAAAGVEAWVEPTVLGFKNNTSLTNASAGLGIYLSEGNQLVLVASVADIPYIGILQFIEDGYAYVKLVTQVCTGA
jgi:hypothetical protein